MELKIFGAPAAPGAEERRWLPWGRRWREKVEEFDHWAMRRAEPEAGLDSNASFVAVTALLGLALAVQYAQLGIPAVHAYLIEHDILHRPAWAGFTLAKQAALFVLMLLVLTIKEQRLREIGFPALRAQRWPLVVVLIGVFLAAALLRHPQQVLSAAGSHWLVPIYPGERVLWVLLGVMAAAMEETFFRGFAIVWTYRWSGHFPVAVLFPALVFAAGHAYLGLASVGFAFLAALVFSGLFLWKRDLFWPMVLHYLIDVWVLLV